MSPAKTVREMLADGTLGGLRTLEEIQREEVVEEAKSWMGTPHRHAARVKGAGVDCGMFLLEVFERVGMIPHVEPEDYPHDWHMHRGEERYLAQVERYARKIEGPPQPGDIVLYRFGRTLSHGAIVTSWPQIIHSHLGRGVVLDDAENNLELASRFMGFWSLWHGGDR